MKNLTVFVVALLAAAAYAVKPIRLHSTEETTILNYHTRIGVPEAKRIQLQEEQLAQNPSRIVGGSPANMGEHPYVAGLLITLESGATSICGASLLSNYHLVTAAHCWDDGYNQASQFLVALGTTLLFTGGFRISTSNVHVHSSYEPINNAYDIAIVNTAYIAYTNSIQHIELPTVNTAPTYVGSWAYGSGFGRHTDSEGMPNNPQLRQVQLQVISNNVCQQTYGANVVAATLCTSGAGGVGICGGDSGGPLAYDNGNGKVLIGVMSWSSAWGCEAGQPSAHTRVTTVMPWIRVCIDEGCEGNGDDGDDGDDGGNGDDESINSHPDSLL